MPMMEATARLKTWQGDYSFAVDGGAATTITLRSDDGPLPIGAMVIGGYLEVLTILNSLGLATAAIQVEGANDTVAQAAYSGAPWSSTGRKDIVPDATGSTVLKLTAARSPALVVGTAALTAGIFKLVLFYK